MGWALCGQDSRGRDIGYGIEATCDEEGCTKEIDRGLGYACGGEHGEGEHSCEGYFCGAHLLHTAAGQLCPTCAGRYDAWVCQALTCKSGAEGTAISIGSGGQEVRDRVCAEHGRLWALGEGCRYIPDRPVVVGRDGERWEVVAGWAEIRRASEEGQARLKATDRTHGVGVYLTLTEDGFQIEPEEHHD